MGDSGTLILGSLITGNTYSGTTNLSGSGTLQLNNASSVGTSVLNYTNGTLAFGPSVGTFQLGGLSGTSNINLIDTASPTPAAVSLKITNAGGNYSGQLSGAGSLTVQGATAPRFKHLPPTKVIAALHQSSRELCNCKVRSCMPLLPRRQRRRSVAAPWQAPDT